MRKISKKERSKAGHIYCPYCKPEKVDAVYRMNGWYDLSKHVACEIHKNKLTEPLDVEYTEADRQTWLRL